MRQSIVLFAAAVALACTNPRYSCSTDANCPQGTKCDTSQNLCVIPGGCSQICKANEACLGANCVAQAPGVTSVTAPTTWSNGSQTVTVTAVVDGTGGPGLASAVLQIAGQKDIQGTPSGTGLILTYSFSVPGSVQASGSDTPIGFVIVATDTAGHSTPTLAMGHGQLLIDAKPPAIVGGVTVNGGTTGTGGIQWFQYAATGDIDVQVTVTDSGSGVDPTSLMLMETLANGTVVGRFDHGTPSCAAGATAQSLVCLFTVAKSYVGAGNQRKVIFKVIGADKVSNPLPNNTAALGIDGTPPTVTFNVVTYSPAALPAGDSGYYPAPGSNCNDGATDTALYCGHDGSHYYRKGETNPMVLIATDTGGSGVTAAGITYTIAGSSNCTAAAPCTAVTDAGGGNFNFVPDFSSATFASGADGSDNTVSLTVTVKDVVGNPSSVTMSSIGVTRTKWARKLANISALSGSPIITPVIGNDRQIILAGTGGSTNDSIVSLDSTGHIVGTVGTGQVTTITNNMAFSPTTNRLYVIQQTLPTAFVYDMAHAPTPALAYSCGLGGLGTASGSPAVIGTDSASERGLIADSGNSFLWAITNAGTSCDTVASKHVTVGTGAVNTPTTDGNNIYIPYGGTGIATTTLAALLSGSPAPTLHPLTFDILGPIALTSAALYFGEGGHYHSYSLDTTMSNWTAGTNLAPTPIVHGGLVFGFGNINDQNLHAFVQNNGSAASPGFTFGGTLKNVSAGTIGLLVGGTPVIYFTDSGQNELTAVSYSSGTTSQLWSFKGTGLTTPAPGNVSVAISALGTEPTMDSGGTLYFGAGTVVYAVISDSVSGPVTPTGGTNWPRVGFDNCNSGNTSYTNCR